MGSKLATGGGYEIYLVALVPQTLFYGEGHHVHGFGELTRAVIYMDSTGGVSESRPHSLVHGNRMGLQLPFKDAFMPGSTLSFYYWDVSD